MEKQYLNFISNDDLVNHIKLTIQQYVKNLRKISLKEFNENLVDPIKLTFDSLVYNKPINEILRNEIKRQRDKSNNNTIGYFHQNIFKYIRNCIVPKQGFDIIYDDGITKYYIELKNKYNTMNNAASENIFLKMKRQIDYDQNCICALVEVIAKKSQNIPWIKTVNGETIKSPRIRKMSIDQFYKIVTHQDDSFANLCKVLPHLINQIIENSPPIKNQIDTVPDELEKNHQDNFKSLYLIVFGDYLDFKKNI